MIEGTPGRPDFAQVYGSEESVLSPRMAEALWGTALLLADLSTDHDFLEDLREQLPPIAQLTDEIWLTRFTGCFQALASRLAAGPEDPSRLTSCTGEEMALHIVIDTAEIGLRDGSLRVDESLPADAERDGDFDWAREVLFRDHDVLLLFEEFLDGIEDGESELNQRLRFANLHPRQWFLPFADAKE